MSTTDNKRSNVKKFLPVLVLATSVYYSLALTAGVIMGYIGCKIYHKLFFETGKVERIFIDCGNWKIHLHHWIMGAAILLAVFILDWLYLPKFFVGVVCGIIFHDFYDFNDWHEILVKKEDLMTKI